MRFAPMRFASMRFAPMHFAPHFYSLIPHPNGLAHLS